MDCLYDADFSGLIKEGKPSDQQLREAWNKIYLEFRHLSGSENNEAIDKIKQIQSINGKIYLVDGIVEHLTAVNYDADLVKILNMLGIPCDLKEGEDPRAKMKTAHAYAKRWVLDMERAQNELNSLQEIAAQSAGRDSYDDNLMAMSSFFGYPVKAIDITIAQYCKSMKKMISESKKKK